LSNAAARPHNPYFRKIKLLNNASRPAEITRPLALYFYATIFRYIAEFVCGQIT